MIATLLPLIGTVLDKVLPDEKAKAETKLKMLEMAERGELAQAEREAKLILAQAEINKVEAASNDPYKSRWRPTVGWICAFGLGYNFLICPILPWVVNAFGGSVEPMPEIDNAALMGLLVPLLGLGAFRSFEKVKGKA